MPPRKYSLGRIIGREANPGTFEGIGQEFERLKRFVNLLAQDIFSLSSSTSGAPTTAEYFLGSAEALLPNGRLPVDTATIGWDVTTANAFKANVNDASITNAKLRDSAGLSVIGNPAAASGAPQDIVAAVASTVLKRNAASAVLFDKVDLANDVSGVLPAASVGPHNVLSAQHLDTLAAAAVFGDLLRAAPGGAAGVSLDAWLNGLPFGDLPDAGGSGGVAYWLDGLPYDSMDASIVWQRLPASTAGAYLRMTAGGLPDWDADPRIGYWTAYTPVWTAQTSDPALGNGTLEGRYMRFGKTIFFRVVLTIGSTTTVGSNFWKFTLPFTAKDRYFVATCLAISAAGSITVGYTIPLNTTQFAIGSIATVALATAGAWQSIFPFNPPATGDVYVGFGFYEEG